MQLKQPSRLRLAQRLCDFLDQRWREARLTQVTLAEGVGGKESLPVASMSSRGNLISPKLLPLGVVRTLTDLRLCDYNERCVADKFADPLTSAFRCGCLPRPVKR